MKLIKVSVILIILTFFYNSSKGNEMDTTIYNFQVKDINSKEVKLDEYKGKVILIVNVASKCGFTNQYKGLQSLYEKYVSKGFVVLGFPCNQFGSQEPGTNEEIKSFCSLTYNVSFPMFDKIDVNGSNAHPLYKFLTTEKKGIFGGAIKWNFTKFLIDKSGKVVNRYAPTTTPESLENEIEKLLEQ